MFAEMHIKTNYRVFGTNCGADEPLEYGRGMTNDIQCSSVFLQCSNDTNMLSFIFL